MTTETKKPEEKTRAKKIEETPKAEPETKKEIVSTKTAKEEPKEDKPQFEVTDFNPWNILKYPHLAEKSMNMVEMENKLVFVADRKANKTQIKDAIERGFNVKVEAVNIEITRKGTKKVYAKLHPDNDATDIASRLGML